MTEAAPHIKPMCPASTDEVVNDTPEKIEPKSIRTSHPSVEVRARYLDTSSGSCHDFCKFGHKNLKESTSSFIAKQRKKLVVNSKTLAELNGETPIQPRVPKLSLSPAKSTIKRASSLSTPGANSNTKYNDIILRNGVGVIQLSPMGGLLSKGEKKELVPPNAPLSPKPPIKRVLSGKSQNVKDPKQVSHLKRHSSVGKGEIKKPLTENIFMEKSSGSDGNQMQSAGKALYFENEKGKQKSPSAVTTRSSLISRKKSLGPKGDRNALSKATKRLVESSTSEQSGTKIQKQMPKKKVELDSGPKRLGKKAGIEEKNDSAHKLGFKRGNVVDVKTSNTAPRRLKFKPRKVLVDDLNGKADDVAGSKTELAKKMTNHKVGINIRLKRVGKVGVEGKKETLAHKLDFERGKVIDVQPKNNAPRRLKFKPRKVIVENINNDVSRRNLKKVLCVDEVKGSNTEHLRVVLKHQNIEGKKDVQSLLNNVIEETATRLVRLRKSKVKALVGAFESLMSLPDAKSSTTSAS